MKTMMKLKAQWAKLPEIIQLVETVEDVQKLEVPNPEKVVVLTQTTLSVDEAREMIDALRRKFPKLTTPPKDDICYATQNRQDAVKHMVKQGIDFYCSLWVHKTAPTLRVWLSWEKPSVSTDIFSIAHQIEDAWLSWKKQNWFDSWRVCT
jgi:4-hydroxy-3-methylbut-2-enyl diphosphate reductase